MRTGPQQLPESWLQLSLPHSYSGRRSLPQEGRTEAPVRMAGPQRQAMPRSCWRARTSRRAARPRGQCPEEVGLAVREPGVHARRSEGIALLSDQLRAQPVVLVGSETPGLKQKPVASPVLGPTTSPHCTQLSIYRCAVGITAMRGAVLRKMISGKTLLVREAPFLQGTAPASHGVLDCSMKTAVTAYAPWRSGQAFAWAQSLTPLFQVKMTMDSH